jgi:ADP-ribosylglycohydrolase
MTIEGSLFGLAYGDALDPHTALRRAATTSGDSDSIAALAGAFGGAAYGVDAFPAGWRERIEYADRLNAVATGLAARSLSSLE